PEPRDDARKNRPNLRSGRWLPGTRRAPRWLRLRNHDLKTIELGRIAPIRLPDRTEGRTPVEPHCRTQDPGPPSRHLGGRQRTGARFLAWADDQQLTMVRPEPLRPTRKTVGIHREGNPRDPLPGPEGHPVDIPVPAHHVGHVRWDLVFPR